MRCGLLGACFTLGLQTHATYRERKPQTADISLLRRDPDTTPGTSSLASGLNGHAPNLESTMSGPVMPASENFTSARAQQAPLLHSQHQLLQAQTAAEQRPTTTGQTAPDSSFLAPTTPTAPAVLEDRLGISPAATPLNTCSPSVRPNTTTVSVSDISCSANTVRNLREAMLFNASPAILTIFGLDGLPLHQNLASKAYFGDRNTSASAAAAAEVRQPPAEITAVASASGSGAAEAVGSIRVRAVGGGGSGSLITASSSPQAIMAPGSRGGSEDLLSQVFIFEPGNLEALLRELGVLPANVEAQGAQEHSDGHRSCLRATRGAAGAAAKSGRVWKGVVRVPPSLVPEPVTQLLATNKASQNDFGAEVAVGKARPPGSGGGGGGGGTTDAAATTTAMAAAGGLACGVVETPDLATVDRMYGQSTVGPCTGTDTDSSSALDAAVVAAVTGTSTVSKLQGYLTTSRFRKERDGGGGGGCRLSAAAAPTGLQYLQMASNPFTNYFGNTSEGQCDSVEKLLLLAEQTTVAGRASPPPLPPQKEEEEHIDGGASDGGGDAGEDSVSDRIGQPTAAASALSMMGRRHEGEQQGGQHSQSSSSPSPAPWRQPVEHIAPPPSGARVRDNKEDDLALEQKDFECVVQKDAVPIVGSSVREMGTAVSAAPPLLETKDAPKLLPESWPALGSPSASRMRHGHRLLGVPATFADTDGGASSSGSGGGAEAAIATVESAAGAAGRLRGGVSATRLSIMTSSRSGLSSTFRLCGMRDTAMDEALNGISGGSGDEGVCAQEMPGTISAAMSTASRRPWIAGGGAASVESSSTSATDVAAAAAAAAHAPSQPSSSIMLPLFDSCHAPSNLLSPFATSTFAVGLQPAPVHSQTHTRDPECVRSSSDAFSTFDRRRSGLHTLQPGGSMGHAHGHPTSATTTTTTTTTTTIGAAARVAIPYELGLPRSLVDVSGISAGGGSVRRARAPPSRSYSTRALHCTPANLGAATSTSAVLSSTLGVASSSAAPAGTAAPQSRAIAFATSLRTAPQAASGLLAVARGGGSPSASAVIGIERRAPRRLASFQVQPLSCRTNSNASMYGISSSALCTGSPAPVIHTDSVHSVQSQIHIRQRRLVMPRPNSDRTALLQQAPPRRTISGGPSLTSPSPPSSVENPAAATSSVETTAAPQIRTAPVVKLTRRMSGPCSLQQPLLIAETLSTGDTLGSGGGGGTAVSSRRAVDGLIFPSLATTGTASFPLLLEFISKRRVSCTASCSSAVSLGAGAVVGAACRVGANAVPFASVSDLSHGLPVTLAKPPETLRDNPPPPPVSLGLTRPSGSRVSYSCTAQEASIGSAVTAASLVNAVAGANIPNYGSMRSGFGIHIGSGGGGGGGSDGGSYNASSTAISSSQLVRPPSPPLAPLATPSKHPLHLMLPQVAEVAATTATASGWGVTSRSSIGGHHRTTSSSPSPSWHHRRTHNRRRSRTGTDGADAELGKMEDDGEEEEEEEECWHELWAVLSEDPLTGEPVIVLSQMDVTAKVVAERHVAQVMEAEHRLLEQLFPRHILQYMAEEWTSKQFRRRRQQKATSATTSTATTAAAAAATERPVVRDCNTLATLHPQVTLLFADIKGFTPMCKEVEPRAVMSMLNDLYSRYDKMLDKFGVFKVETIGDCYFVAGGLIAEDEDGMAAVRGEGCRDDPLHAYKVFAFAKAILAAAREVPMPITGEPVQIRIGIHTGPVVSGIAGTRMPRFCLFGDTVNTASRMESTGVPGAIHASEAARRMLPDDGWVATDGVEVKGKGLMQTYLWRHPDDTEVPPLGAAAAAAAAAAGVGPRGGSSLITASGSAENEWSSSFTEGGGAGGRQRGNPGRSQPRSQRQRLQPQLLGDSSCADGAESVGSGDGKSYVKKGGNDDEDGFVSQLFRDELLLNTNTSNDFLGAVNGANRTTNFRRTSTADNAISAEETILMTALLSTGAKSIAAALATALS